MIVAVYGIPKKVSCGGTEFVVSPFPKGHDRLVREDSEVKKLGSVDILCHSERSEESKS